MAKSIVIFGPKENGKSTLANCINDMFFKDPSEISLPILPFTLPIKLTLARLSGRTVFDLDSIKTETPKGWTCTVRQAYQRIGECVRAINPRMFTDAVLSTSGTYLVDDGRFEDEANRNRELGGMNILVIRPRHINDDQAESETWVGYQAHKFLPHRMMETVLIPSRTSTYFDMVIYNDFPSAESFRQFIRVSELIVPTIRQYIERK